MNVFLNIALNLFFLLACPKLQTTCPVLTDWWYTALGGQAFGIGWIFVANIISTLTVLVCLMPELMGRKWLFSAQLLRKMLKYSWPLLILGVAGILSQNMGQMLIPYIFKGNEEAARSMVGIYGANIKIAIVMVMFTQAFRYAYEPFIFSQARNQGEDSRQAYRDAMKYFVIFGLLIFLGVMFFLPVLKYFVSPGYWSGLQVVPVMMMAELFFGVFFNLSVWYKITDRTHWGMIMSLMVFALMLGLNLWFVPSVGIPNGYMGSAWAALISYFCIMVFSWFVGRKYYPIKYPVAKMAGYFCLAMILWGAGMALTFPTMWLTYAIRILLLGVYVRIVMRFEHLPGLKMIARRGRI